MAPYKKVCCRSVKTRYPKVVAKGDFLGRQWVESLRGKARGFGAFTPLKPPEIVTLSLSQTIGWYSYLITSLTTCFIERQKIVFTSTMVTIEILEKTWQNYPRKI